MKIFPIKYYWQFSISIPMMLLFAQSVFAQAPIPIELFAGNRSINYQHIVNKEMFENKVRFFNVTSFESEYNQNENYQFFTSSLLFYNLSKRFSLGMGGEVKRSGVFPVIGSQYTYLSKKIVVVVFPTVNLNGNTKYAHFSLFEYRSNLNDDLKVYFRAQILFVTNFEIYNRGYQQFRLGLQKNNIQFGLATNFDQFNNNEVTTNNIGIFVRNLIF